MVSMVGLGDSRPQMHIFHKQMMLMHKRISGDLMQIALLSAVFPLQ
jgi:hypothetical protein